MTDPGLPIPPHRTPAARAQKLIPAAVVLLGAVVVVELLTLTTRVWPIEPLEMQWRVQAFPSLLSATPQLLLLVTMIAVAAVYAGKHRAVRAAAVAYCALGIIIVILAPIFAIDSLSMRHLQPPDKVAEFTYNVLRLGAMCALLIPAMAWAAIKSWSAGKPDPIMAGTQGHGLIVGAPSGALQSAPDGIVPIQRSVVER